MSNAAPTDAAVKFLEHVEQFEDTVLVAIESGALENSSHESTGQTILDLVKDARKQAQKGHIAEAAHSLNSADAALSALIHSQTAFWRVTRIYQLHIYAYYVVVLIFVLNVASGWRWFGLIVDELWGVPMAALGLGALGATLRGLYWLHRQVDRRIYRIHFILSHLAAPAIGALFGMFAYLLLLAGLLTLEGGEVQAANGSATPYAVYSLIFLAGFSWEWVLGWVDRRTVGRNGRQSTGGAGAEIERPAAREAAGSGVQDVMDNGHVQE